MLVTDIAYKLVAFALLAPLVSVALRIFLALGSGSEVAADTDILFFVLSPVGLIALVAVGAVLVTIVALEQACLMAIGFGARRGARVGFLEALQFAAHNTTAILALTARIVVRVLAIAAPFLAAGGLVALWLLTDFDINYYLSERPPAFWTAAVLIGVIVAALAVVLVPRIIGWSLALPILLFEQTAARDALPESRQRTSGATTTIGIVIAGWAVASLVLSGLAFGAVGLVGRLLMPWAIGSLLWVTILVAGLLVFWGLSSLLVTLVTAAAFSLLIVELHERLSAAAGAPLEWPVASERGLAGWRISTGAVMAGLVVAGVVGVVFAAGLLRTTHVEDNVVIIAHRGAAGAAPENTMASVLRAIEDGADFVEIDVQENADGRVIVVHDSDFMKVAGVATKVWEVTDEELQDIDIGSWFAPEFSGERVPGLDEVLAAAKGRARVNIELKYYGHDEQLEQRVSDTVDAAGMSSDIVAMSLKYDAVQKMKALRPDWRVGLLTATAIGNLATVDADFLAVNVGIATPLLVRDAHAVGKEVYAWTVNDPISMSQMIGRGVDGIITDEPALARRVLEFRAGLSPFERLLLELAIWLGAVPRNPGAEDDLAGAEAG
jgi:glycerophosphoryl diester phosphodiesterase